MRDKRLFITVLCWPIILVCGCAQEPSIQPKEILNPCAPEMLGGTMKPLQGLMRAFDDGTELAYHMPRPQVSEEIAQLQDYRREVADLDIPSCLLELKEAQVAYMDSVINNLLAFLGGASGDVTVSGLETSAKIRDQYEHIVVDLLGITSTPRPTHLTMIQPRSHSTPTAVIPVTGPIPTTTTQSMPQSTEPPATPTPLIALAIVTNPEGVNVRHGPGVFHTYSEIISLGEEIPVIGRSIDAQWLLVLDPETRRATGWVYAPLVELDIPIESIPIQEVLLATPTP